MKPPVETLLVQAPEQVDVGDVKDVLGPPKPAPPAAPKPGQVAPKLIR